MDYNHLFLYSVVIRWVGSIAAFTIGLYLAKNHWNRLGLKCFLAYYCLRIALLWAFCMVGGAYPMDLPEWHSISRWMVDEHLFPGIGFHTGYFLGFNGILALSSWLWNSPFAIAIPWTLCEMSAMGLFFISLRKLYDETTAKRSIILYLLSPVCLFCSWLGAQDEPLYLLFAGLFLYSLTRDTKAHHLFFLGFLSIFFTKMVIPLFLLPFFLIKRWRGAILFASAGIAYLLLALALGTNPFDMQFCRMGQESASSYLTMDTQPGCLWYFTSGLPKIAQSVMLVAALGASGLFFLPKFLGKTQLSIRQGLETGILLHGSWILVLTLLFRYNFAAYLVPFAFFIAFQMAASLSARTWSFYETTAATWMSMIVIKDFLMVLVKRQLISSTTCDILSLLCLAANVVMALAFILRFRFSPNSYK